MNGVERAFRKAIDEAFQQSQAEYEAEIRDANDLAKVEFAGIRPVFITGNPSYVQARNYILFVGLNPKLETKPWSAEHNRRLDARESNPEETLDYFRATDTRIHGYFSSRAKILAAFAGSDTESTKDPVRCRELLRTRALFCEAVPYHSGTTPTGSFEKLQELRNVKVAHSLIHRLITEHPPACVVLDGAAAAPVLPTGPDDQPKELSARTGNNRPCRYTTARMNGIPVVRCAFIRSRGGPNSNAQLREFGRLLAGFAHAQARRP